MLSKLVLVNNHLKSTDGLRHLLVSIGVEFQLWPSSFKKLMQYYVQILIVDRTKHTGNHLMKAKFLITVNKNLQSLHFYIPARAVSSFFTISLSVDLFSITAVRNPFISALFWPFRNPDM